MRTLSPNGSLARVGDKWSILVVCMLSRGSMRFTELKRSIGSISQKVLTTTLRRLERDGYITRKVTPSIPPRVDYELTELGTDVLVPVTALAMGHLLTARTWKPHEAGSINSLKSLIC